MITAKVRNWRIQMFKNVKFFNQTYNKFNE